MERVAGIAVAAVVVAIYLWAACYWWVACETMDIEVGADRLFVFFVVVLATFFAFDFVNRRTAGARMVSGGAAGVYAGVHAGGVTIIAWTAAEMASLEVETEVYVCMFAATLVWHWLVLRRRRRRGRRQCAPPHR